MSLNRVLSWKDIKILTEAKLKQKHSILQIVLYAHCEETV